MIISAALGSEYLLRPSPKEFRPFYRVFGGNVIATREGYTLAAYSKAQYYTVKGAEYFGIIADKTRSFDNRQSFLDSLGLVISLGDNEIIDASKGVRVPTGSTINPNQLGMVLNYIPQLLAVYQDDKIMTAFNGDYDFKIKLFKGQCDFMLISDYLKL